MNKTNKEKIYLAIPYKGNEKKSFEMANKIASKLMNEGKIVYSPISHNHPIAEQEGLPHGWDFWEKYDTVFVGWCDVLYVCKIKGWEESIGVKAEIKIAKELKKKIKYLEEDELNGYLSITK